MNTPKKSLGQHWLDDTEALEAIIEAAEIKPTDTILEIGPGLGSLTRYLVEQTSHVVAVELDPELARQLPHLVKGRTSHIGNGTNYTEANFKNVRGPSFHSRLEVVQADILEFDLESLPAGYKVVANIPYYLTSSLLRRLAESPNPPKLMVLLVQKEVAQRICADAGQMSILAVSVQLYYQTQLGLVVPKELFKPAPKVDSQVVILKRHARPLFKNLESQKFFQLVKAGFSERRKKLRSSLSGGLDLSKDQTDELLRRAGIDGNLRAQNLSLEDWHEIYKRL